MTLALDENPAQHQIKAYQPGFIQVNDTTWTGSLIISATDLVTDWAPQSLDELKAEHLLAVLAFKPKILLIGTGEKLRFPALAVYGDLLNQGIGVEIMDTRAACHTFNALTAEGREVAGALLVK